MGSERTGELVSGKEKPAFVEGTTHELDSYGEASAESDRKGPTGQTG